MPRYLIHQTADGMPIGVYTPTHDYYTPEFIHLRTAGRDLVYSQLPSTEWADFIERLADTRPTNTMKWDTYYDASSVLSTVLEHARRDVEILGESEPE
jgi:hypothetical protein